MRKNIYILFLAFFVSQMVYSQFSVGISLSGIGYHQGNTKTEYFKWKLSKNGKLAGFASISFYLSYQFNDYIGIKAFQSLIFKDCIGHFSGITHIGIDFHDDIIGWKNPKSQFSATFGPFWYYRKNWLKEERYIHVKGFLKLSENKKWEHKFVWYGGQIDYSYFYNSHNALTLNFLPAYPYLYTFGIGTKFKN